MFYGAASTVYRLMISLGIALFLIATVPTLGLLLAAWLIAAQVLLPLARQLRFLLFSPTLTGRRLRSLAVRLDAVVVGGTVLESEEGHTFNSCFLFDGSRELGRYGIRVNAVAPGFIGTEILNAMPQKILDGMVARTPIGRMGDPADIASAYVWLASDAASFVTGATLSVDGGLVVGT